MNKKDFDNDEIDLEGIENDPDLLRELAEIDEELYLEASSKAISNPTTKKISTQKSSSTKATDIQNINLDISHLLSSNTDNLHVDFNEDDENDPELLAALEGLKDDFINTHEPETKHSRTELSSALLPQLTIVAADTTSNVKSSTSPITSQTKSSNQLPVVAVSSKPTPAVSQSQTQLMVPKSASTTPSKVSSTGDTSLRTTSLIAQYKQKALVFKKEGRLDEAKEWLIKAKNLEKCEGIKGI